MTIAQQYARALHDLVQQHPEKSSEYLQNLTRALEARGHRRLLPSVLVAYEALDVAASRARQHQRATPAQERTRVLLQLYTQLVASR